MHVLFLNSWYPNRNAPTLGNFVKKHAEAAALFNTVSCLAIFPSDTIHSIETVTNKENNLLEVVIYYPEVKNSIPGFSQWKKLNAYRAAFFKGLKIIQEERGKIDLTHLNVVYPLGIFALELKKKRHIPFVVTEHSTAYHDPENKFSPRQLKLTKKVLRQAAMILPVSNDLGKAIARLAPNTPQRRVTNVVDPEKFVISNKKRMTFVHISTLDEAQKNPTGIIDVLAELKAENVTVQIQFISDFSYNHLKKYANDKGLTDHEITFAGPLKTEEVADVLKNARALILFSNYENFPCVIAEAFMSGVPVISTNVNGIPEYVNETNGILIPPRQNEALKNALKQFIEKEYSFQQKELRDYALTHFSYDAIGKAFNEVYIEVKNHVG